MYIPSVDDLTGIGFEPTISAGERPAAAHLLRSWVRIPINVGVFSTLT